MTAASAKQWDLNEPREEGWFLNLVLHGLHEETQTLEMVLALNGSEGGAGAPSYARLIAPKSTSDERVLYGSSSSPPEAGDPHPVIRVGKKLVIGREFLGGSGPGLIVLPIAHLFHWFENRGKA